MANKRGLKSIKLSDYFAIERNRMVTYRIIPHLSVTNNQNAKLWRMLHKIYEIYDGVQARSELNNWRLNIREKDTIWYDVVFRPNSVQFYVSTTEIWAKKLRELFGNYLKATVEEVDITELALPADNIVVNEMRLARHDIFALDTKQSEQTSPIATIISALNDIGNEGDYARLSVCAEVMNRRKWAKNASWAHEKLTKGKVPQRAKITASKAQKVVKGGLITFINEIYDVINDTLNAFANTFFKSEKAYEKKVAIERTKGMALIDEINSRKLSDRSNTKINQPVWKTRIRIATSSREPLRAELANNTISSAFSEIAGDNEMLPFKVRMKARKAEIINELNTLQLSARTKADGDCSLLSCDEMSKVALQLPTASVQQKYEDALSIKRNVETDIPAVLIHKAAKEGVKVDGITLNIGSNNISVHERKARKISNPSNGILVGHSEVQGVQFPIGIPTTNLDETFRSYALVGAPRMGKDTLAKNMVAEACLNHGIATFVLDAIMEDGERGFADGIRDTLPPDKIIDLDLSDTEYPIPLDLTEVVTKLGPNGANRFAQELIDFFGDIESMGQSRAILREFAKASGGSIFEIKRLLEDEEFRVKKAGELRQAGNVRTADLLDKYTTEWGVDAKGNPKVIRDGQKTLDGKAGAILNRLDELLGDDTLFRIFAQPSSADIDFAEWIREGKVVIIRMPNRKLGTLATKTLVHWVTLKVFMTKLLMAPSEGSAFIVFNEPHQYMTAGLKALMQRVVLEGPKWRLAGIFAFHHFGLLEHGLDDDLISGGINWFLFANDNRKVFERLEAQLKPTFDVDLALMTEAYHAIFIGRFGGRRQNAFLMKALAPPSKRMQQYDNSFLTRRHARQFGRHWTEVEKMLA
jgi:hypothetical protein